MDFARCARATTRTAILVPSYLDADHPMIDQVEREIIPEILLHAYIAARRADLRPLLVRELDELPPVDLVLVPSTKALTGPGFAALTEHARAGGQVYLSWFAGAGQVQRGAWWPPLEPLLGVRHRLRYGLDDLVTEDRKLEVVTGFGDLVPGDRLTVRPAGPEAARAWLPVEPAGAEVLVVTEDGAPALLRHRVGAGAILLGCFPVEYFGSQRRDANAVDDTWRLYRALGDLAGALPAVRSRSGWVAVDELSRQDGRTFTTVANLGDTTTSAELVLPDGVGLVDVRTGARVANDEPLAPYATVIARRTGRSDAL